MAVIMFFLKLLHSYTELRMFFVRSHREIEETESVKLNYKENSLKSQLDNGDKDGSTQNSSDVISHLPLPSCVQNLTS